MNELREGLQRVDRKGGEEQACRDIEGNVCEIEIATCGLLLKA